MPYIIYKTTNLLDKKYYIGIHYQSDDKFDGYYGSGNHIKNAIKKYGKQNFIRETLFSYDSELEALKKEKEIVSEQFIKNKDNYNVTVGGGKPPIQHMFGDDNPMRKPEIASKVSKTLTNRPLSEEHRKNIGLSHKGLKYNYPKDRKKTWNWITNGKENKRIKKDEKIPDGFKIGLTKFWKTGVSTKKHKKVSCPHCNKNGGEFAMLRWHFNNCRNKDNNE